MAAPLTPYLQQHAAATAADRQQAALRPDSVAIDGRDADQLLDFLRALAPSLRFANVDGRDQDWSGLFARHNGAVAQWRDDPELRRQLGPHAALLLTFLELYDISRLHLNRLSDAHLAFYYRRVLGLQPRPPQPDRVHLLYQPARNRQQLRLPVKTVLKAGDLHYLSSDEQFVDQAVISRLHSVYRDPAGGRLHYALAADSADGLGEPLEGDTPSWPAFGHRQLAVMQTGFAIAGPVLMLAEGERSISVDVELAMDLDAAAGLPSGSALINGLEVELSGADAWIGPLRPTAASLSAIDGGQRLSITVKLATGDEPVVIYNPTKLVGGFAASAPVMKVQLRGSADPAIQQALANAHVNALSVRVAVTGVTNLHLENDLGRLNADKPFMPFGPQPANGSRFYIGSPETFAKQLDDFSLQLQWQDVPTDLSAHYRAYLKGRSGLKTVGITVDAAKVVADRMVPDNDYFSATMRLIRATGHDSGVPVKLFDSSNASLPHALSSSPESVSGPAAGLAAIRALFTASVARAAVQFPLVNTRLSSPLIGGVSAPLLNFLPTKVAYPLPLANTHFSLRQQRRVGYIQISLDHSFLHRRFPYLFAAAAIDETSTLAPNPPYTPVLESLSMDYHAASGRVEPGSTERDNYQARTLQLFHITPFGQAEEHGWLKQGLAHVSDHRARLLPAFEDEGSLLIGLQHTRPGSDVELLLQLAEGSANPIKSRRQVRWSLLSGNHWRPFEAAEVRREQTNQLLRSGRVSLRLPSTPLPANTALDPTLCWLRASIDSDTDAVCRFIGVHAQAGEAELNLAAVEADVTTVGHLDSALPAGTISKTLRQQAGLKSVSQPYASFGGHSAENDAAFATRVAERLRHRQRALSRWDYEHLTLQQFPQLYSVKVLSHTRPARAGVAGSAEAAGHVTVVAVPDIRNRNAYDPLQPRTDLDTLSAIEDYLNRLSPPGIRVYAVNPDYQAVRLELGVVFGAAFPFGPYRDILNVELQRRLSPWAFDAGVGTGADAGTDTGSGLAALGFGGRLHSSELLQFIAALDYVERVDRLRLFHLDNAQSLPQAADEVLASGAAAVLVSHPQHLIHDATSSGGA